MAKSVFHLADGTVVEPVAKEDNEAMSVNDTAKLFVEDLKRDLAANNLSLPTLPNIAIEALFVINDVDSSADDLARIISKDPSMTSRLIRYANSALFGGENKVSSIRPAITRIGFDRCKNAIYAISMKEVFRSPSPVVEQRMEHIWEHSVKVAKIAATLCQGKPKLDPETALVAGLIHDVGAIPVVARAIDYPVLLDNPNKLNKLIDKLHTKLGAIILAQWKFDMRLVQVASEHEDLSRKPGAASPDYVDLIQAANMISHIGTGHPMEALDHSRVPALARLGVNVDQVLRTVAQQDFGIGRP